ncbi:hypothetical protein GPALN_009816 [Globodera pallida]|nr:hypothetical protein GPALN_009816 [Globodera pallida]
MPAAQSLKKGLRCTNVALTLNNPFKLVKKNTTELIQELRAKDECKTKLSRAFAALMTTKAGWASSLSAVRRNCAQRSEDCKMKTSRAFTALITTKTGWGVTSSSNVVKR